MLKCFFVGFHEFMWRTHLTTHTVYVDVAVLCFSNVFYHVHDSPDYI